MLNTQRHRTRTRAIIIVDGNTLDIVHVYVNHTMREAVQAFLQQIGTQVDFAYSDMKDEVKDMLDRYQFIETSQISIGRR